LCKCQPVFGFAVVIASYKLLFHAAPFYVLLTRIMLCGRLAIAST
jgi:hypothetical protein